MPSDDRFADAVKPALEALLSDLQHTTEVLRRSHRSDRRSESRDDFDQSYDVHRNRDTESYNNNIEKRVERRDYSRSQERIYESEPREALAPVYSRPSVQSLLSQVEEREPPVRATSSRKSLGPPSNAHSYADIRSNGRSPSRDPVHSESMIGTMNGELSSKHGVNTIPKGDCAACGKPIIGQVVIALGKMWHPEHYTCCECNVELGQRPFFERNGRAYCEEDYHSSFSPKCQGCHRAITDRCVTAMNKNFHIECFTCVECNQPFGEDGFHEKNGQTYCKRDFFRLYAPKCNGCQQAITSSFITALGTHWHPDCFVCQGNEHFAARCPMDVTYFEEEEAY
uniref:LIM zinc-binding domain-containing protein n=2 Tax=Caenorhabditis japonica TaxID=281687 RepID=A0A8R1DUR8_CAEJA